MDEGITWSRPDDEADINVLHGWVDSDFAADPDNRRSTTGFLRNLLRDFGEGQTTPTAIFEDNASCICMSENPRVFRRRRSSNTESTCGARRNPSKPSTRASRDSLRRAPTEDS